MRGSTLKTIRKFVDILDKNTPEAEKTKTKSQLIEEVKSFWVGNPERQKFIHKIIKEDAELNGSNSQG